MASVSRAVRPASAGQWRRARFSWTHRCPAEGSNFSRHIQINPKHVFTLSWSSSGPAAYAASLQEKSSVTGSFIAMSVFKPLQLPPLNRAKGHAYYLLHSPDDTVCPFWMAEEAVEALGQAGATTKLGSV